MAGECRYHSTDATHFVQAFGYHDVCVADGHQASDVVVDLFHHIWEVDILECLPVGHTHSLGGLQVDIILDVGRILQVEYLSNYTRQGEDEYTEGEEEGFHTECQSEDGDEYSTYRRQREVP